MAYQTNSNMSKDDWAKKEKRELFCKAVNSILMNSEKLLMNGDDYLTIAKTIVDTAFKNYPDNTEPKGEKIENIIK